MRRYLLLILVLLLGLWLWLGGGKSAFTVEPFTVEVPPVHRVIGRAYWPSEVDAPVPALLFCHGISSSKENFAPLAEEFARRGIASIMFDFGGHGRSYRRPMTQEANLADVAAVLDWMRQQPQLDQQQLGILGHSMGGTTALETAKAAPNIKTTLWNRLQAQVS
jgi:pimeloyl-ACP methyl ester carboxylesterase